MLKKNVFYITTLLISFVMCDCMAGSIEIVEVGGLFILNNLTSEFSELPVPSPHLTYQ